MKESAAPSGLDRELSELRARAYGPHPDIDDDPQALARLDELESARLRAHEPAQAEEQAAHEDVKTTPGTPVIPDAARPAAGVVAGGSPPPRSVWQRLTATAAGRVRLIVGCVVVVLGTWFAASWFAASHAETTLQPTAVPADSIIRGAVSRAPLAGVDMSTLRSYEDYRRLTPWVADGAQGSRCLMLVQGSTLWGVRCAPPEAELMLDIGAFPPAYEGNYAEGLADGTVIRFQVREDAVEVYLYPPSSAD